MTENNNFTFSEYRGPDFQMKIIWQILVDPEFGEHVLPHLSIDYFDNSSMKRLLLIINEYRKEFEQVPNLKNKSIYEAINLYKSPKNTIEEEELFSIINRINLWNERVINKDLLNDGDSVQKGTNFFIKQQEYRKLGELILKKTSTGEIKDKRSQYEIEEFIEKINNLDQDEDYGTELTEGIKDVLSEEFRQTIPTGIKVLDEVTGGGLGKSEIGLILSPSGVGKSTILTKIANTAYELGKNVLQIIFEDTEKDIKRKHYTIWSGVPLSDINENRGLVEEKVNKKIETLKEGRLVIRRFSQDDTTMEDIKNWIKKYEKRFGIKFDIVILDYLDCLEPSIKTTDRNEAELSIIKGFLSLAADKNVPGWTAVQSNRQGFDNEIIDATHQGGSIKRYQKSHLFMSIAKTPEMKESHLANIRILKARFAQDGQTFRDCIFNNNTMEIRITDSKYNNPKASERESEQNLKTIGEQLQKHREYNELSVDAEVKKKIQEEIVDDELIDEKSIDSPYTTEEKQKINDLLSKKNEFD